MKQTLTILIVDDHEAIVDKLVELLKASDREIYTARTYNEAIAALEQIKPDVLITDYVLDNDNNGLSLIRKARSIVRYIKIMVYSGYYTLSSLSLLCQADVNVIVDKADSYDDLLEGFNACLNEKEFFSSSIQNNLKRLRKTKTEKDPIHLSPRLKQTLRLILDHPDYGEKQLARELNISTATVHSYIKILREKFNVPNRAALINHPRLKEIFPRDFE